MAMFKIVGGAWPTAPRYHSELIVEANEDRFALSRRRQTRVPQHFPAVKLL